MKVIKSAVHFKLCNSKNIFRLSDSKGIGLKNVKKRLQLLYPEKYELSIVDNEEEFCVNLVLKIENV